MAERELATLAGGCFWCLEAVYQEMGGILAVESGYMGGHVLNPTYQQVCTGATGHAEVVQLTFDPSRVTFANVLEVFFAIHDPTTLNRQGNDVGTQYRSAIFYHSDQQRADAHKKIRELESSSEYGAPIVTEVVAASTFYKAENYHQDYFHSNANQPYCAYVVSPKVSKFRKNFAAKLKCPAPTEAG